MKKGRLVHNIAGSLPFFSGKVYFTCDGGRQLTICSLRPAFFHVLQKTASLPKKGKN